MATTIDSLYRIYLDKNLPNYDRQMALGKALHLSVLAEMYSTKEILKFPVIVEHKHWLEWLKTKFNENFAASLRNHPPDLSQAAYYYAHRMLVNQAGDIPYFCIAACLDETEYLEFCRCVCIWRETGEYRPEFLKGY
jgi:hypothetical protein